jgi:hypothetical protein
MENRVRGGAAITNTQKLALLCRVVFVANCAKMTKHWSSSSFHALRDIWSFRINPNQHKPEKERF